ncbi:MAG TPA: DEAD/DEAH box helicase, partial [Burkholderiaceae bacterium]
MDAPDDRTAPPVSAAAVEAWLAARGWRPFAFQREVWRAMAEGRSGLLHANTGTGKTLAAWLGALQALRVEAPTAAGARSKRPPAPPLSVLWLTPMRALAADTTRALVEPLADLAPAWTIGLRSGDTTSAERSAQDRRLPTVLVTTPESLTLQLARADALETLAHVQLVVVDEWHELLGNKRGVQVQLALARLRRWCPGLVTWGLSATLGNPAQAMGTLLAGAPGRLVRGDTPKT